MKAVIPVAGIGTRLRPHTHTQPKALLPVAGKPILGHIIDSLIAGGVNEFVFVIGYLGSKIQHFVNSNYDLSSIKIHYVVQQPREGIGHAIFLAREYIKDEKELLIMLGDSILELNLSEFLSHSHTILGIRKVDNPRDFGIAELNSDGYIKKLVEKPKIPKSNLALVGIYKINNPSLLLKATEHVLLNQIKTHGEYQLTDILMHMIENGEKMNVKVVDNWFDCGKKGSLLEANAILLERQKDHETSGESCHNTIIIPPVSIGPHCIIKNSIIGPYVAIGENSTIISSIVKDTIVGSFSELQDTILEHSIIGNDSSLKGLSQSLNIGDNTEIHFTT